MPDSREILNAQEIAVEKAHALTILQMTAAKKIIKSELAYNSEYATGELITMIAQVIATNYKAPPESATGSQQ